MYTTNSNKYINNGLFDHLHTDYLVENNKIPNGTVFGYNYWYRNS